MTMNPPAISMSFSWPFPERDAPMRLADAEAAFEDWAYRCRQHGADDDTKVSVGGHSLPGGWGLQAFWEDAAAPSPVVAEHCTPAEEPQGADCCSTPGLAKGYTTVRRPINGGLGAVTVTAAGRGVPVEVDVSLDIPRIVAAIERRAARL